MKHKKYIAIALTALLTFGSAQTALAAVIYHDINKTTDDEYFTDDAYVINGNNDKHIFITKSENATLNYSIIVNEGVITHIVLQGINIETTDENGIKIGSNANVVLELDGTNSITVNTKSYDAAKAGINVAEGTLTITGGEDDSLDVKVIDSGYFNGSDGAAIGSDEGEDFSGTITIEGGNITAVSEFGAGIGSGDDGKMSGTITISGGEVTASSGFHGAGIGSGWDGEMSGTINISGGEVTASSGFHGAGIGSGLYSEMSGTITISDGKVTASSGYYGAGIGAGDYGDITESGSITIGGDAAVTANSSDGLGIGSGDYGNMNGKITITDDAKVDITLGDTSNKTGIGAGEDDDYDPYYEFNGSINILEHANVVLKYENATDKTPAIGSTNPDSAGEITLSTGAEINGTQASDVEALKALGILNDNAGTTTVEPTPEPENPDSRNTYSLKQLHLVQRINEAEGGEVVAVSEEQLSKGKLPAYALEALAKKENVTLAILCEKFDILIPSEDAVADAGSTQFYTIDELVEMYE